LLLLKLIFSARAGLMKRWQLNVFADPACSLADKGLKELFTSAGYRF
jgi:hypothetical protein